jgi:motility quorum-sensing regulator/GCU-specific mRNA interferase toxin
MEKRTPHCTLAVVRAMVAAGKVRATLSALAGGAALGFDFAGVVSVVAALTPRDFYKSMTPPITVSGRTSTGRRRWPARCM